MWQVCSSRRNPVAVTIRPCLPAPTTPGPAYKGVATQAAGSSSARPRRRRVLLSHFRPFPRCVDQVVRSVLCRVKVVHSVHISWTCRSCHKQVLAGRCAVGCATPKHMVQWAGKVFVEDGTGNAQVHFMCDTASPGTLQLLLQLTNAEWQAVCTSALSTAFEYSPGLSASSHSCSLLWLADRIRTLLPTTLLLVCKQFFFPDILRACLVAANGGGKGHLEKHLKQRAIPVSNTQVMTNTTPLVLLRGLRVELVDKAQEARQLLSSMKLYMDC